MGHQFIALFRCSIETYRIIHLVISRVWDLLVGTIDRRRRGIDKMLDLMMAASLKNVVEPDQIRLDIGIRIGNRIAHTRLGRKIHNHGNIVLAEDFLHGIPVCNRRVYKRPVTAQSLDFLQAAIFEIDVVIVCNRIDSDNTDILYIGKEAFHKVASDEAGGACNEDGLALKIDIIFQHD